MITRFHCNDQSLLRMLGDESCDDFADVLAHIETCETCQVKLDTLSSGGLSWREVNDLMQQDELSPIADSTGNPSLVDSDRILTTPTAFLRSSDHSGSLGRFDRYEIIEILGRGGMGVVMRGYDPSLDRHCAVKVLAPELATSSAARKRFSREAKSAAAVVHPHVVPIQTVDEYAGLPYLVMPVIEGKSLQQRVESDGPLSAIESVRIALQIAEGLAAAHAQGLVHRDIKPANILLKNGIERVQITDFGLARAIDDASMTRSGVIAGTPQYMSPEQAHGDSIDHRSDLFSLGSVMYCMLTGRSPFRAETTMGVLNRIGNDEPRSLQAVNPDIPLWMESIVMKLLSKSPEDRFGTAQETADLLEGCLAHMQQPTAVPLPESVSTSPERYRTPPIWKWFASAAAAASLIVLSILIVVELNKGKLTIQCEADDVPIRIVRGEEIVEQLTVSKLGKSIRVVAGDYVVEIDGNFDGMEVANSTISLQKRGNELVRIVRSDVELNREAEVAPTVDPTATTQVVFKAESNTKASYVSINGSTEAREVPFRHDFDRFSEKIFATTPITVTWGRALTLPAQIEIYPSDAASGRYLAHNSVPIEICHEDIVRARKGEWVTRVVYLPHGEFQATAVMGVETLVSWKMPNDKKGPMPNAKQDPMHEARKRGTILAVLRYAGRQNFTDSESAEPGESLSDDDLSKFPTSRFARHLDASALKSIVYLVDVSASMSGAALNNARAEVKADIRALRADQKFLVQTFNETTTQLLVRGQNNDFCGATNVNKQLFIDRLTRIQPSGGTDHLSAIKNAMQRHPDAIFLITDSDEPNAAERQLAKLIVAFPGTKVFVCRLVTESSAKNSSGWLMQLAMKTGGEYRDFARNRNTLGSHKPREN